MCRKSLTRFDAFSVAMASLLLAAKIEEKPILIRDVSISRQILNVFKKLNYFRSYLYFIAYTKGGTDIAILS